LKAHPIHHTPVRIPYSGGTFCRSDQLGPGSLHNRTSRVTMNASDRFSNPMGVAAAVS
jgi:hypothetical protein